MTVPERIKEYLNFKRVSVNSFSKDSGLTQTTLNRQINGTVTLSVETVIAFLDFYPELSAEWLLRGKGPMEKDSSFPELDELQKNCNHLLTQNRKLTEEISVLKGEKKDRA